MFQGKRVKMRALDTSDIDFIVEHFNEPETKANLTPGAPFPATKGDEIKFIEAQTAFGMMSDYSFAFESLESGAQIGCGGYNSIDWKNRVATVGLWLAKPYWNQGYGTDIMRLLIRFAFEELNLNKLNLRVYSFNKRGLKCYQKAGFSVEGTLRQEIFRGGQYHDQIVMGILKSEFEAEGQ